LLRLQAGGDIEPILQKVDIVITNDSCYSGIGYPPENTTICATDPVQVTGVCTVSTLNT